MRMTEPSLVGLMPISEAWIAFSIGLRVDLSHGWITRMRASATEIAAIAWTGVGVP